MNAGDRFLIFCPAGRGSINHKTVVSIFEIQKVLIELGYDHRNVKMVSIQGADIVEARNIAATIAASEARDFRRENPEAELRMIGIDDDVGVAPGVIAAMVRADLPYVGTCIPQRNKFDFDAFSALLRDSPGMSPAQCAAEVSCLVDSGETAEIGISRVEQVGTGFFVLKGSALLAVIERGKVAKKTTTSAAGTTDTYGFYELVYHRDDGGKSVRRLSEDYSFCYRLRKAGIPVHAYRGPGVSHVGEMVFTTV